MVFGLFSKDRALQRTIEKATNKLAQQPDRWGALEKLREDGSDDALYGLCKRFGVTSMKGVEDEQEKTWVVDVLVEKGPLALTALVRYMKGAEQLAFPLRVLEAVRDGVGPDRLVGVRLTTQQAAKFVPIAGSAVSAVLTYTSLRYVCEQHIQQCVAISRQLMLPTPSVADEGR